MKSLAHSDRGRAGVAGARAYRFVFRLLLERVRDPASGAADREQRKRAAGLETERAAQRHQCEIDVRLHATAVPR